MKLISIQQSRSGFWLGLLFWPRAFLMNGRLILKCSKSKKKQGSFLAPCQPSWHLSNPSGHPALDATIMSNATLASLTRVLSAALTTALTSFPNFTLIDEVDEVDPFHSSPGQPWLTTTRLIAINLLASAPRIILVLETAFSLWLWSFQHWSMLCFVPFL